MRVVIVAKTRMGSGACVGGITADGRSVRLIDPFADPHDHTNLDYLVGDVWELDGEQPAEVIPPHTENILVYHRERLRRADNLTEIIERFMPPRSGGPEVLYEGRVQVAGWGSLYIAADSGIPPYSTMFWRPDQPLRLDTNGRRLHYRYESPDGDRRLTFVGFQEPLDEIPAGSLVRVSLAHWWRPDEDPDEELRCYVQLSGWIPESGSPGDDSSVLAGDNRPLRAREVDLDTARETLRRVFGYDEFRPMQEDIITNVLGGRDTLAVMPTGSGKSLCYQLPALLSPGVTVVVSPLISLMEDQVLQLRQVGVPAVFLNSSLAYDDYLDSVHSVRAGRVKLVYTSPETLVRPETLRLLRECRVDCLTVDEAHCISEWGHDFRPEYRQLLDVRRHLPAAACVAVTATATERVRQDIKASLNIHDADEFLASFDRPNLYLSAEPRVEALAQILGFLDAHRGESGIIYCATRATVDWLAAELAERGWPALPYHAGLDNETRRANQREFTHGEDTIIVATIAFGMGINKSNVRFIVHHDLPKDLESYYQQIGRAGRDGLRADCLLLHSQQEVYTSMRFIDEGAASQRAGAVARLQAMIGYAETDACRRRPLLAYFGDDYDQENCGHCDNCLQTLDGSELVDLTEAAQKFLSCVYRTGQLFGASHVADVLRGSRGQRVLSRGHDQISTYGIGREFSKHEWQALARQFVQKGLLVQDMSHGGLRLTEDGMAVLKGEPFHGTLPDRPARAAGPEAEAAYDRELFELLRTRRHELAAAANVPPYVVLPDTSLRDMATYFPQSRDRLFDMHGLGEYKVETYGDAFLEVIRDYCRARGIEEQQKPGATRSRERKPAASRQRRQQQVVEAFNQGWSVPDLAAELDVQERTLVKYLWDAARAGARLDPDNLLRHSALPAAERDRVLRAFAELGTDYLRPVYDALGETVSFEELHLLRLYVLMTERSQ